MHFRPATPQDCDPITRLHVAVAQQSYAAILPHDFLHQVLPGEKAELWRGRMEQGIDLSRYVITVAEEGADLAGFACFIFDRSDLFGTYLHNLYVSPDHQRKGVACGLLVSAFERFPVNHLARAVHLNVYAQNAPARALYDRLGGVIIEHSARTDLGTPEAPLLRYQWASAAVMLRNALAMAR